LRLGQPVSAERLNNGTDLLTFIET